MKRCFVLAQKGGRDTLSNPNVGCVIVHKNRIIGEGYHKFYGGPHAEIEALNSVSSDDIKLLPQATLYVSLEPCSHFGKTPPCVHKIVASQIPEVVIGCLDPNPVVAGNGVKYLQAHGVKVRFSNTDEAKYIIRKFTINLQRKPYITLKWAQSADGFIGRQDQKVWLSAPQTSILTHYWRSQSDAIAIGKNTFLTDRPQLTDRYHQIDFQPRRILFDTNLSCIKELTESTESSYIILNEKLDSVRGPHKCIKVDMKNLQKIMTILFQLGITSIIIEGGALLLNSFIKQNIWHEAIIIKTAKDLSNGIKAPLLSGVRSMQYQVGTDTVYQIMNNK